MHVSIVTAVYNRRETIAQAMRSVQRQSYPMIEHIIQDGGSTDGTLDVIQSQQNVQTELVSAPDKGIYDAINLGIMRAKGEIIGLMHSDDFFAHDTVIEKVVSHFRDPAIDGVYGDLDYVSAEDPAQTIRSWQSGEYRPALLAKGWMPPHPTLYLRREVFDRLGLYDTSYAIAADYDAILRYLGEGQIKLSYIPEVLVKMRVGGASNRSLKQIWRKSNEDLRAIRANKIGGLTTLAAKNLSKLNQFL